MFLVPELRQADDLAVRATVREAIGVAHLLEVEAGTPDVPVRPPGRILWRSARRERSPGFTVMPEASPTAALEWHDEEQTDPMRIKLDLDAMLTQPFVPARGRSRCEHERNLTLAHFYATMPTRNTELREAVWQGLQVWNIKPARSFRYSTGQSRLC